MADNKRIIIELRTITGNGGSASRSGDSGDDSSSAHDDTANLNYIIHPIKSAEKALLGKSVLLNQAYGLAKQAVKQSVMYGINRHFNLTENYMAQTDMQNILTTIGKVSSLASAVGAGAMLGAGAPGAIIAAVGWVVNEGIGVYQRFDQAYIQLNEGNMQSNFQRVRMGLTDGGRGTQN